MSPFISISHPKGTIIVICRYKGGGWFESHRDYKHTSSRSVCHSSYYKSAAQWGLTFNTSQYICLAAWQYICESVSPPEHPLADSLRLHSNRAVKCVIMQFNWFTRPICTSPLWRALYQLISMKLFITSASRMQFRRFCFIWSGVSNNS